MRPFSEMYASLAAFQMFCIDVVVIVFSENKYDDEQKRHTR